MAKGGGAYAGNPIRPIRHLHPQSSSYGDPIPVLFGETFVPGNIVWADNFQNHKLPSGSHSGKKSGGFSGVVSYIYSVSLLFCLGEGATPVVPGDDPILDIDDVFNFGLMRPGGQVVSVVEAKTPITKQGADQDLDKYSPGGLAGSQNLNGVEPGVKRGKRIWYAGTGRFGKFRGARFHDWGGLALPIDGAPVPFYRFITWPDIDDLLTAFPGDLGDDMADEGNLRFAPLQYRGFAMVANHRMNLGANASVPNMGYVVQGLKQFWQHDLTDTPIRGPFGHVPSEARDAAPDRVISEIMVSTKHGAGWDRIMHVLQGYDAGLGAHSPFWNDGASSYGASCRANGILISPRFDTQSSLAQLLDDLTLITDAAPLFSEGMLKIIPWGTEAATRTIHGQVYDFTPATDATSTYPGANVAVRDYLTMDDFVVPPTGNSDPADANRIGVLPDQQTGPGYFNVVNVEFESRIDGYVKKTAQAEDLASSGKFGDIVRDPISAPCITREELAKDTALRVLQRFGDKRSTYKFTVGWWFMHWEPMDVIVLPGESIAEDMRGMLIPVRLTAIAENEKFELQCEADRFPRSIPAGPGAEIPAPNDEEDEDFGIVLGTVASDTSVWGNPSFLGLNGLVFSNDDRIDGVGRWQTSGMVLDHERDINITELSMHMHSFAAGSKFTIDEAGQHILQDGSHFTGSVEIYWNVDGETIGDGPLRNLPIIKFVIDSYRTKGFQSGTDVWWPIDRAEHTPDLDLQKLWSGLLEVSAGSRVTIEQRIFAADGHLLSGAEIGETEHYSQVSCDFQAAWEVAT